MLLVRLLATPFSILTSQFSLLFMSREIFRRLSLIFSISEFRVEFTAALVTSGLLSLAVPNMTESSSITDSVLIGEVQRGSFLTGQSLAFGVSLQFTFFGLGLGSDSVSKKLFIYFLALEFEGFRVFFMVILSELCWLSAASIFCTFGFLLGLSIGFESLL